MPAVIPNPLPPWANWALKLNGSPGSLYEQFIDFIGSIGSSSDPTPGTWRHVELVWKNNTTNIKADECIVTLDLANITNGGLDSSWTEADYATTDAVMTNLFQFWGAHMSSDMSSVEARYYIRGYRPYSDPKPFTISGPPEHIFSAPSVGQDVRPIAHQVALTHTEITAFPRHWGRSYWPCVGATTNFQAGGYFTATACDTFAQAIHDQYNQLAQAEFFVCVPTTQVQKVAHRVLLGVTEIQVDNVPDVVRRRRPRNTTYRKTLPTIT